MEGGGSHRAKKRCCVCVLHGVYDCFTQGGCFTLSESLAQLTRVWLERMFKADALFEKKGFLICMKEISVA